ncbi:MAG: DUF4093 domain-containing protein [Clostridiales bacterium]|nr:DUF4093 domain-containing protein [Clostridiales bacterium]
MIRLNQAVIVEGKYDKIRLSGFIDAVIIETDGFRIFSDKEKKTFIKRLAESKGIIIMTDSDSAGFKIRSYLIKICGEKNVVNAYIPDVYGKEKRKSEPSKEGKLGVEGLSEEIITAALERAGITGERPAEKTETLTSYDLYRDGFAGGENSREKKRMLLRRLGLPERLSTAGLLKLLNTFISYEDYKKARDEILGC